MLTCDESSNRSPDPHFADDERLFRRVREWANDDEKVWDRMIDLPACCANREKYSTPEQVLTDATATHGIIAWRVDQTPREREFQSRRFRIDIVHLPTTKADPEGENYAHTEVHTIEPAAGEKPKKPPHEVKRFVRYTIARAAVLLKPPA